MSLFMFICKFMLVNLLKYSLKKYKFQVKRKKMGFFKKINSM